MSRAPESPGLPSSDPFLTDTHGVINQASPLADYDPLGQDVALTEGLQRYGAHWAMAEVQELARAAGRVETRELGDLANRFPPRLRTHDRFGRRLDEVEFHPAWHQLMTLGVEAEIHSLPWSRKRHGSHVARVAKHYLLNQVEAGIHCPLTMTFAAVPALRQEPAIADVWVPRLTSKIYDPSAAPAGEKRGALMGMAMTEKQGGSDVRANTTRAIPAGRDIYRLMGHKWFCSAPMCDAFLTLAYTDNGLTCFLVPRRLDDGSLNPFQIQRLKDKLGNRSNASSEIEYRGTWAWRVGAEGRGIATILHMVSHTRLDCVSGSAGLMRQALCQALHHCGGREAFGKPLVEQPLMQSVLADLAVESEAATQLTLRLAAAYDTDTVEQKAFRRLAGAVAKYWVCKRGIALVAEAMECLGGNGYVEESIMPRLYREMPVNSIWEGSGNVICLDVLRALGREPETVDALMQELSLSSGLDPRLDQATAELQSFLVSDHAGRPAHARALVERLALLLQAGLVVRHSPAFVAETFLASRLGADRGFSFGIIPSREPHTLLQRAWPSI